MLKDLQTWMPLLLNVTLPIVFTIAVAAWLNNKRIDTVDSSLNHRMDDLNRRLDETNRRIDDLRAEIMPVLHEILATLKDLDRRVTALEERSSRIVRQ